MSVPWQVWVSEDVGASMRSLSFRFNARFASRDRADQEVAWYHAHGYNAYTLHDATTWKAP